MEPNSETPETPAKPGPDGARRGSRFGLGSRRDVLGMLVFLALLVAAFGLKTEHFLSRQTVVTIANQTPDAIVLAVGFSAFVGVFFGFYPARRASRLLPIQALRYE